MHEWSICRALLARIDEAAAERPGAAVETVSVAVSPLAGITPDELARAFATAAAGTRAAGARLQVRAAPPRWRCLACGADSEGDAEAPCPACGSDDLALAGGDGVVLERVDLSP